MVCIDEKTQIQALERTAPILPIRPGLPEKQTHGETKAQGRSYFTVTVIFFMTTMPLDMAGRSAPATLGNS